MSSIEQELRSQPDIWLKARDLAAAIPEAFPPPGARVAIMGCGTSLFMAQAIARWREDAGKGATDAFAASEFPRGRHYDLSVAISRSGTTTEVVEVLEGLGGPSLLVTADCHQPAAARATRTVELAFANEDSVVQTRFATGCSVLWRAHVGHDIEMLVHDARTALGGDLPAGLSSFRQFVFLGRGAGAAIASEAALKLREAAGCWSEAYPAMEFRHGPISAVGPHSLVWSLDPLDDELLEDVLTTGAAVHSGKGDPLVELVKVQRAAVELASAKGLDPDRPRHLSRSVILAGGSGAVTA